MAFRGGVFGEFCPSGFFPFCLWAVPPPTTCRTCDSPMEPVGRNSFLRTGRLQHLLQALTPQSAVSHGPRLGESVLGTGPPLPSGHCGPGQFDNLAPHPPVFIQKPNCFSMPSPYFLSCFSHLFRLPRRDPANFPSSHRHMEPPGLPLCKSGVPCLSGRQQGQLLARPSYSGGWCR